MAGDNSLWLLCSYLYLLNDGWYVVVESVYVGGEEEGLYMWGFVESGQ